MGVFRTVLEVGRRSRSVLSVNIKSGGDENNGPSFDVCLHACGWSDVCRV